MSSFSNIKSGIVTILQNDDDLDANSVFNYEPSISEITQDPFAVVIPSENESEFGNTAENRRNYAFLIRLFVERNSRGETEAEDLMTAMVDRLINSFDQDITLSVSGVLFTRAAPSSWGYILGDKEYRTADIKLQVNVWYDTTT